MFSLKDKVVVITGGGGLLGKEMVSSLRLSGAIVISTDVHFKDEGPDQYLMDITSETSVRQLVNLIVERYGKIDGWVNNAYPRTKDWGSKLEDIPFVSWQQNIDMHLNGYFLCCQIALEQMRLQKNGSLINMSSIYGLVGPDFTIYEGTSMTMPAAYSAIKGGINNLSRYLASYYGPDQIRVNVVSPGGIYDNQPKVFVDNYNKKVPLKRMGTSKDIVSAIHYLLTDEASYITGHNLVVDGGWSAI